MLEFYAVPAWQLVTDKAARKTTEPPVEPLRPAHADPTRIAAALGDVEYRGQAALARALGLVSEKSPAIFARSPNDLPALLRTADQLLTLARRRAGERAQVWRCRCGSRYAVPVVFVRPVTLPCERCGSTVELDPGSSLGVTQVTDPETAALNATRQALSEFFHEAMARGWPVLVDRPASTDAT